MFVPFAKPKGIASLGYGVMVTLQILVLSFLVRIQVAQLSKKGSHTQRMASFFCIIGGLAGFAENPLAAGARYKM